MLLIAIWLNGQNYLVLAQFIRRKLKGKKRLNHIEGNAPNELDLQFESWKDEDSLIMTWLWGTMISGTMGPFPPLGNYGTIFIIHAL